MISFAQYGIPFHVSAVGGFISAQIANVAVVAFGGNSPVHLSRFRAGVVAQHPLACDAPQRVGEPRVAGHITQ